tara:strand:- start:330 stop:1229 length:900 start_codon:yes stop_codon:yes gene_type:complete
MLTICIPVYNFDITPLIISLEKQLATITEDVKLVLIDDASGEEFKRLNKEVSERHHYIELFENIGRSKVRNLFLKHSNSPYLLFLDCDVIIQPNFIKAYIDYLITKKPDVVCGGRIYPSKLPGKSRRLSYNYGVKRESKSAVERNKAPNDSFMTNNFIIKRAVLESYPFDERLKFYGHEDTLLGLELKKARIRIDHIENPVINGDIEVNSEYLRKTAIAISNLVVILNSQDDQELFIKSVRLLNVYLNGFNSFARFILNFIFRILKRPLTKILKNGSTSIVLFDFYKLGILGEELSMAN